MKKGKEISKFPSKENESTSFWETCEPYFSNKGIKTIQKKYTF